MNPEDGDSALVRAIVRSSTRGVLCWIVIGACVAVDLWLVALILLRRVDIFTWIRITYQFNTLALPFAFAAAAAATLVLSRAGNAQTRPSVLPWSCFAVAGVLVLVRFYASYVEPRLLQVRHVRMESSKLQIPLRIVHVSDIQSDRVGRYEAHAFGLIAELKPDLVLFTGDLIQPLPPCTVATEFPKISAMWKSISPPLGKFGVSGDTDRGYLEAMRAGAAGFRLLENEDVVVTAPGVRIRIFGLSHGSARRTSDQPVELEDWLAHSDSDDLTILVGHSPDFVLQASDRPIDLCLAGHTHGGQIRLPFVGPLITMSRVPRDIARGFHEVGRTRINVSAGIGTEHAASLPAIRVGCPPEFTVIDIVPAADRQRAKTE